MIKFLTLIGGMVIITPFVFGLALLIILWRTWWLYPAWAWFIVPLGAPAISFYHFAALMVFVGTQIPDNDTRKDDRDIEWEKILGKVIAPIFIYGLFYWLKGSIQ
jgi:hypothetical protein